MSPAPACDGQGLRKIPHTKHLGAVWCEMGLLQLQASKLLHAQATDGLQKVNLRAVEAALLDLSTRNTVDARSQSMMVACMQELRGSVQLLGSDWKLEPFGSCANGFCSRFSDLDVTCYRCSADEGSEAAVTVLRGGLAPLLKQNERFRIVEEVWHTRVPIVKLRFHEELDVDLSCFNLEALRNTGLLRRYAQLSPSVTGFVMAVKAWAKAEGVVGAPQGHLSSYSMTLLALYFLQVDPALQLPCLPLVDDGACADRWTCSMPLARVVARFFQFYVHHFGWGREVVSLRLGRRLAAEDAVFHRLSRRDHLRLHVEDPFLHNRNLNCVLRPKQEAELRCKFRKALQELLAGAVPAGLLVGSSPPSPLHHSVASASSPTEEALAASACWHGQTWRL